MICEKVMKLSVSASHPCTDHPFRTHASWEGAGLPLPSQPLNQTLRLTSPSNAENHFAVNNSQECSLRLPHKPLKLSRNWKEYQGLRDWEGLLDPLDENLRREILRYGQFVEASYLAFDFDHSSPSYATCKFPKSTLFQRAGMPESGYTPTKNLQATSGIKLPGWVEKAPKWAGKQSSWIGYVAVCHDKEEIRRLGRRDIVISYRGTATCLEWLENLRATLTHLPDVAQGSRPMVERGFLSLYTSGKQSLQKTVRTEIARLLQSYGDEPLSLTVTGHSLGAALAVLTAYDIKSTFRRAPMVTVVSFGGPRVGNRCFSKKLEKQGTKVLRIVNSDDLVTKLPGFVFSEGAEGSSRLDDVRSMQGWVQRRVEQTRWVYAEVGRELRLRSRDSPFLTGINMATCHDLKTYLHLVGGFQSSSCPFRSSVTGNISLTGHSSVGRK